MAERNSRFATLTIPELHMLSAGLDKDRAHGAWMTDDQLRQSAELQDEIDQEVDARRKDHIREKAILAAVRAIQNGFAWGMRYNVTWHRRRFEVGLAAYEAAIRRGRDHSGG